MHDLHGFSRSIHSEVIHKYDNNFEIVVGCCVKILSALPNLPKAWLTWLSNGLGHWLFSLANILLLTLNPFGCTFVLRIVQTSNGTWWPQSHVKCGFHSYAPLNMSLWDPTLDLSNIMYLYNIMDLMNWMALWMTLGCENGPWIKYIYCTSINQQHHGDNLFIIQSRFLNFNMQL